MPVPEQRFIFLDDENKLVAQDFLTLRDRGIRNNKKSSFDILNRWRDIIDGVLGDINDSIIPVDLINVLNMADIPSSNSQNTNNLLQFQGLGFWETTAAYLKNNINEKPPTLGYVHDYHTWLMEFKEYFESQHGVDFTNYVQPPDSDRPGPLASFGFYDRPADVPLTNENVSSILPETGEGVSSFRALSENAQMDILREANSFNFNEKQTVGYT